MIENEWDGVETLSVEISKIAGVGARAPTSMPVMRFVVSGELNSQRRDVRALIRINHISTGYSSFVHMGGHHNVGEWDHSGFYAGRSGWSLDCDVFMDFTISAVGMTDRRLATGQSTFAHSNGNILGYRCHGYLNSNQPIRDVSVLFPGGIFTGNTMITAI